MTSLIYNNKFEKKLGYKNAHYQNSPNRSSVKTHTSGTMLSVEIMEVRLDNGRTIAGGPFLCVLEVIDSTGHPVWKQKTTSQTTIKSPIVFGDAFKVKSGESPIDIKTDYRLQVEFCVLDNQQTPTEMDRTYIPLEDLAINKDAQIASKFEKGLGMVVVSLGLSNPLYPRGASTPTLREVAKKEQEKPESNERQLNRTESLSSYSLPRVNVKFQIHYYTVPGEELRIVGSNEKLGDWDPHKAPRMEWTDGGIWVLEIPFRKVYLPFEYKYVILRHGHPHWEQVKENRKVESSNETEFIVRPDHWERI